MDAAGWGAGATRTMRRRIGSSTQLCPTPDRTLSWWITAVRRWCGHRPWGLFPPVQRHIRASSGGPRCSSDAEGLFGPPGARPSPRTVHRSSRGWPRPSIPRPERYRSCVAVVEKGPIRKSVHVLACW